MIRSIAISVLALGIAGDALADVASGQCTIKSRHSGLNLDVANVSDPAGANVQQYAASGNDNQKLNVTDLGNGTYSIRPAHTNMSLDVWEWSTEAGGDIRQWDYLGADNQKWIINDLGNGYHSIISAYNGLSLDVYEWSTENGGDIRQWDYTGAENQQWVFQSTSSSSGGSTTCVDNSDITDYRLSATGESGPYNVSSKNVSGWAASGFGGGTIWYPTNANECGRMPGIAVVPGYLSYESSIEWWGERLASWGYVVITIDTNTIYDQPPSRGRQLSDALDHIISDSTTRNMVDASRLGAIGWSMGGGGSIWLANNRPEVRAIIPQAPWYATTTSTNKPAFYIACESDAVAPTYSHVNDFYRYSSGPKMKIEINNGSHWCANSGNGNEGMLGKAGISWMKRYINGDTRFNQFLCGQENYGSRWDVSDYDYASCP